MITTTELRRWLNPWPIAFGKSNQKWGVYVESLERVSNYFLFHGRKEPKQTAKEFVNKLRRSIKNNSTPPSQFSGHYVEMLASNWAPVADSLTIIVDKKLGHLRIVDGDHRLLACLLRKKQKLPMKIKYVGVVKEFR